jgi:hypothetical protein
VNRLDALIGTGAGSLTCPLELICKMLPVPLLVNVYPAPPPDVMNGLAVQSWLGWPLPIPDNVRE